jgi:hypothetical protein
MISKMKLFIRWGLFEKTTTLVFKHYGFDLGMSEDDFNKILESRKLNWVKEAQREFSQIFNLNFFIKIKEFKSILLDGFFFHYYLDFRGRIYADSPIAYTQNRLLRYIYYYGEYTSEEINSFNSGGLQINLNVLKNIIEKTNLVDMYPKINFKEKIGAHYVTTIFFEIGKIFKKELISYDKDKLSFDEIYNLGIHYYNNPGLVEAKSLYSQIEFLSLVTMLDDVNNGVYLKYPIFKDATASGIQLLTTLLGGASVEIYEYSNLIINDVWHDTYSYIIRLFLQKHEIPENLRSVYFTRQILKKIIMTYNYNATLITC